MVKWEVNKNNEETIAIIIVKMLLLERVRKYFFLKGKDSVQKVVVYINV